MVSWSRALITLGMLVALLETSQGFFFPSSWSTNPNPVSRKPDTGKQWSAVYNPRDYPYFQQQYTYDNPQAMPVAISYPITHSQPPAQPQPQPQPQTPQPVGPMAAASFHVTSMHLVPCMCSVPKEAVHDTEGNSLVTQKTPTAGI